MSPAIGPLTAAALALTLGACATQSHSEYDPVPKFASLQQPTEKIEVTGSRIKRSADADNLNRDTLSPTSVITREEIDARSETGGLYRFLLRRVPNMIRDIGNNN
jgi:outer membrane cobalamin receptor